MSSTAFARGFDHINPVPRSLGGKGASLCRLVQLGYRVPPGFVIPVQAFEHTCAAIGLVELIALVNSALSGSGDLHAAGAAVQARLLTSRITDEVMAPIHAAGDALALWNENAAGVIVRSSATVEDSAAHSFAGIFESIPITRREELEGTIRDVWASVFSPRALSYYREIGLEETPLMAVVVQRFLDAERSGVMFTRFAGRTLVEHVEGGCEKLVKGEVTPEQLWMPAPGEFPAEAGLLGMEHARELSRLAESLEKTLGAPQDVEWLVYGGVVHVVQSRPITTSASRVGSSEIRDEEGIAPVLRGIPASGGWGTGPVHLVFNIEQALALETGQVLVTPMTNPDMVVAMRKAAAIVTDVGGMICHAAIVSRELGLPCVVGTAAATTTLATAEVVSVSGSAGAVYRGIPESARDAASLRPAEWADLWSIWSQVPSVRSLVPIVSSRDALSALPGAVDTLVLIPDVDLRCDDTGLWLDLEGMNDGQATVRLRHYFAGLARLARERSVRCLLVYPLNASLAAMVVPAVREAGEPLQMHGDDARAPDIVFDPSRLPVASPAAFPLAAAATLRKSAPVPAVGTMREAEAAALDTLKFFGHKPGSSLASMPGAERRSEWWELLPEYGRFHHEYGTRLANGEHTWLEVRPELVISSLLKSFVQPGFEMVPRVMGFPGLPPMHIKWIQCRYHFRADTFALVWQAIVRGTWDADYMADLMRRVRGAYDQLEEVQVLFPASSTSELAAASSQQIVALITSWWPRWVEFFALCWFIQAQGDDILYPFVDETVRHNLARATDPRDDFAWPGGADLVAPTTPVMSGAYMASVGRLRSALLAAGLHSSDAALAALGRQEQPEVAALLARHLEAWHWMRDRDLIFEPWDSPARVLETALRTDPHAAPDYAANLRRNRLALSVHFDLALASGRAEGMNHAARFLHDLNVERENHHVLWLKYSYPLRRLVLEVERRLVQAGSLDAGDIFFMQAPELVRAARHLPAPLPAHLVAAVKNRRRGFEHEAKFREADPGTLQREDDYY